MPIEVMGAAGTTKSVQVTVPSGANVSETVTLQLQIHGLEYQTQASVKVNSSSWIPLNNSNVKFQGLGGNYGGIGGGFATLSMLVSLPSGTVQSGTNTVSFKFNATDGNSDGFRVLAFNFLSASGSAMLPASPFTQDNPANWLPPSISQSDIQAGKSLYQAASITQPVPGGSSISLKAHCGDCHTRDGRDLKYFNYSNNSIYQRALFHGLNNTQANQIVSYIRSMSTPAPTQARPWNPPYQPGPGLDSQPVTNWAAGAGLSAVLANDGQMQGYIAPGGSTANWAATQTLNARNLPIAIQLPDWNHWLPKVHPLDAFGSSFSSSNYAILYGQLESQLVANDPSAYENALDYFDNWSNAQDDFLVPIEQSTSNWDANNNRTIVYSASEWMMVKLWEINQMFGLEGMASIPFGAKAESSRSWYSTRPFMTSPNMLHIPAGTGLGNGARVTQQYLAYIWYHLQLILNPGNGTEDQHTPIDYPYVFGFIKDLNQSSSSPNAMLQITWLLKGLQEETAHGSGPQMGIDGWYWAASDPEDLVDPNWASIWSATSASTRTTLTTAYASAWLAQASTYTPQQFYTGGYASPSDNPSTMNPNTTFAGAIWWMLPRFRFYGVNSSLLNRYYAWAASMWPSANWSLNESATCWNTQQWATCSTD